MIDAETNEKDCHLSQRNRAKMNGILYQIFI